MSRDDSPSGIRGRLERLGPTVIGSSALCVVALIAYLRRVLHGGFLSDDWVMVSTWHNHPSVVALLRQYFNTAFPYRPGDDLGLALLYGTFGEHAKGHLAFSVLISVVCCVLLAEILREVGFASHHAYIIGAIALVAPYASAARLWSILGAGIVGVALAELAILVGLRGARRSTRAFAAHCAIAGLLVFAGILTYEVMSVVVGVSIVAYLLVMSPKRALILWGATLAGDAAGALETHRARVGSASQLSTSTIPANVRRISDAIPDTVAHALFPLQTPTGRFALCVILLVVVAGVLTAWRTPDAALRSSLTRWLLLLVIGALVALAGWAVFVVAAVAPYTPTDQGVGNRVNFVSSLGLAPAAYALGAIVVGVVSAASRLPQRVKTAAVVTLGLLLVVVYTRETRSQVATYQVSYAAELAVIGWFQEALPAPPPASSVLLYGAPVQVSPGVPVFGSAWELGGALQVLYSDPTITAVPVSMGIDVKCAPDSILVNGGNVARWSYDHTYLADYRTRKVTLIKSAAQCTAMIARTPL